ncbi:MAG: hypothetical protein JG782_1652 [Anaerophaga sp.]|jgi:hypothetical protein|nr:hypothetical protein [Anaerophaga sp.]
MMKLIILPLELFFVRKKINFQQNTFWENLKITSLLLNI